jgi:hypothetical protein
LVVGLCVGFCQKGLGVTFEEVENLLLDMPVVLLAPARSIISLGKEATNSLERPRMSYSSRACTSGVRSTVAQYWSVYSLSFIASIRWA